MKKMSLMITLVSLFATVSASANCLPIYVTNEGMLQATFKSEHYNDLLIGAQLSSIQIERSGTRAKIKMQHKTLSQDLKQTREQTSVFFASQECDGSVTVMRQYGTPTK